MIDVITGKTATLTTGDMKVSYLHVGGAEVDVSNPEVNEECLQILWESIILGTDANLQMVESQYKPSGSPVDVALLELLIDNEKDVRGMLETKGTEYKVLSSIPFNSSRKRRTVAYQVSESEVMIVMKGAPEEVVTRCAYQLNGNCDNEPLEEDDQLDILNQTVTQGIATQGWKPLSIAFKKRSLDDFLEMKEANGNFETEESRAALEDELTLLATVGLSDPLRPKVNQAIQKLSAA